MIEDPIPALKKQLAAEVLLSVEGRHWMTGARLLRIDFSRMCHLRKGRLERFSAEKLIRMLANVNRRVDISVVNTGPEHIEMIRELYPHLARPRDSDPVDLVWPDAIGNIANSIGRGAYEDWL